MGYPSSCAVASEGIVTIKVTHKTNSDDLFMRPLQGVIEIIKFNLIGFFGFIARYNILLVPKSERDAIDQSNSSIEL